MSPPFPEPKPGGRLALLPFFAGLAFVTLGILMLFRPLQLLLVLVVLLGIPVLILGVCLVLFSLDLLRGLPRARQNIKVGKWRFWSDRD